MIDWRAVLFAALSLLLATPGLPDAHILRIETASYVTLPEMIEDLRSVQMVFVGEIHDEEGHHQAQLQVIRALRKAGIDVAVAVEMFRSDDQEALDRWVSGEMPESEFVRIFQDNWSAWPQYREIFLHARREKIPLVGLNIPREITRQVAKNGMASLTPKQLGELPKVRCDVDARYKEFIRRSLGGHPHNGAEFLNFCEAQLLWDSVMAQTLLDYRARHPGRTIVVLAGSGHAWKYGIPEQIRRRSTISFRVLVPEVAGRIEAANATPDLADYLLMGVNEAPLH